MMRRKIGLEPIVIKDGQGLRTNNVHVPKICNVTLHRINVLTKKMVSNIFPVRTTERTDVILSNNQVKSGKTIPNWESLMKKDPDDKLDFKRSKDTPNRPPNGNNRFMIHKFLYEGMTRVLPRRQMNPNNFIQTTLIQENLQKHRIELIPNMCFPIERLSSMSHIPMPRSTIPTTKVGKLYCS